MNNSLTERNADITVRDTDTASGVVTKCLCKIKEFKEYDIFSRRKIL